VPTLDACAYFPGVSARELAQVSHDPADLDRGGRWAVAIGFEGETVLARFREWDEHSPPGAQWRGVTGPWHTSLSRTQYQQGVRAVQAHIGRGWVYQVNLCRVLSAPCDADDLLGLYGASRRWRVPSRVSCTFQSMRWRSPRPPRSGS
jgi:para-aminobenzoate synthetase component 1